MDVNADMGEGAGQDATLMPLITSANVACGAHAGDPAIMRATVALALRHGVAIGAHPGFDDRAHFGRRELDIGADAVFDLVMTQVRTLQAVAVEAGARVAHVKPHGALYNMSARRPALADAIARAVLAVDASLVLFGLPDSAHAEAAATHGLRFAREAFADRNYRADGTLVPRSQPGAILTDPGAAAERVVEMATAGVVATVEGMTISMRADTVCIHGDGDHAVAMASAVRDALMSAGVRLAPVG